MITIKEIAEMTGVSPTTVQNVIHGRTSKVSKENLERIRAVLKETRYVPRLAQETLTKGHTRIIGVVIFSSRQFEETLAADPFYGQIIGYLEEEIRRAGFYMMLFIESDPEAIFEMAASWNMTGVVAVSFTEKSLGKLRTMMENVPVAAVDTGKRSGSVDLNVGLDDEDGGFRMTEYLLERGYEHILFLSEPEKHSDNLRLRGYRKALEKAGKPYRERYVLELERVDNEKNRECLKYIESFSGKNAVVFCASDLLAVKVIHHLNQTKICVPDDIGVAGFDDNLYAKTVWPPLTTMHQSVREKAQAAMKMLLWKLGTSADQEEKSDEMPMTEILLKSRIVPRGSTR